MTNLKPYLICVVLDGYQQEHNTKATVQTDSALLLLFIWCV